MTVASMDAVSLLEQPRQGGVVNDSSDAARNSRDILGQSPGSLLAVQYTFNTTEKSATMSRAKMLNIALGIATADINSSWSRRSKKVLKGNHLSCSLSVCLVGHDGVPPAAKDLDDLVVS